MEDIVVDFEFTGKRPGFGDLFEICGTRHPGFPPEGCVDFRPLADLQISQIDDYFGLRASSGGDGDDVAIWLYPTIAQKPVDHHPGPFDGVQLSYSVLRNPPHRLEHFKQMLEAFSKTLPAKLVFEGQQSTRGAVVAAAETALTSLQAQGITPGSRDALDRDQ